MALPTLVALVITNTFGYSWFAKYEVFNDYDSFEKYIEDLTIQKYFGDIEHSALTAEDWDYFHDLSETDQILDKNGNVLCEYRTDGNSILSIEFSFEQSEDGLPIKVLTNQAARKTYNRVSLITEFLIILIAAELLAGTGYYIYKIRKIITTGLAGSLLCGYKPLFPACL